MKKALIITYYWPPSGGSGVQRWLKFVKYFRDFNVEPVVYTVDNAKYPIVDHSLLKEIPEGIEVLRQPIWEPNSIFSLFGKKNIESAGFLNPNPSFFGKIIQYIRANYFIPDARKFWIKPSVSYLEKYISKNKIDVIVTTGPPHSVHLIGLQLKNRLNCKWIADFRDPWTEIDYFHQLPLTKSAIKKHHSLEQEVLKRADAVLVVGNTIKENFSKYNNSVYTITNGFDDEIMDTVIELDSKFSLTHIGLMNSDRNPKMFWEVLNEISNENVQFSQDMVVKLIGKVSSEVLNCIIKNNLSKKVEIINYLLHKEVFKYQMQSQILLLFLNNVPSAKGIITGKIFEYLSSKRPILAIGPSNGDLANILKLTNSGTIIDFNEKQLLKSYILELYHLFLAHKLELNSVNIEQYHRKELTKKVSEIINEVCK
ncbi:glycosyltransferase [Lutibacter sp.]|uniref:glycosyltransferase n=1 Tax=Lutibacter sp. TaxID=1925666 RepID=UPI002736811E|nr:glycosyltransferase [Lutibacter sp.]MDP3314214.1 glycosyltransferase [Lutibacter sp.]